MALLLKDQLGKGKRRTRRKKEIELIVSTMYKTLKHMISNLTLPATLSVLFKCIIIITHLTGEEIGQKG